MFRAGGRPVIATGAVAIGQALYLVYGVLGAMEIDRPAGWDATSLLFTAGANCVFGLIPLAATFIISYFTRESQTGQLVAVLVGSAMWILCVGGIMSGILGMATSALWAYPVLGMVAYGLALFKLGNRSTSD